MENEKNIIKSSEIESNQDIVIGDSIQITDFSSLKVRVSLTVFIALLTLIVTIASIVSKEYYNLKFKMEETEMAIKKIENYTKSIEVLTKEVKLKNKINVLPLKELEFRESTINNSINTNILRLFDNAEFAIRQNDFSYAEKLINDANSKKETILGLYNISRLKYYEGNINDTEDYLKRAIEMDNENKYPELRFYLAIILDIKGKKEESKIYVGKYLNE